MKKALSNFGHKVGSFFKTIWENLPVVLVLLLVLAIILYFLNDWSVINLFSK